MVSWFVWVTGLREPTPELWPEGQRFKDFKPIRPLQKTVLSEVDSQMSITDLRQKFPYEPNRKESKMALRPVMAAFDQGVAPKIACWNMATVPLGVDYELMINSLQRFITEFFAPVWGTPAELVIANGELPNHWSLVFMDDADAAGALGYHDLTAGGLPLSKIFVKTTLQSGEKISVTAAHEIAEMLVDPAINLWAQDQDGTLWAYEMSDAVESETFEIDGVEVSDFVYPAYFESFRAPGSRKFDHLGKVTRPFEILSGGYSIISKAGQIKNVFGSKEKEKAFEAEDRRLHRSAYRGPPG